MLPLLRYLTICFLVLLAPFCANGFTINPESVQAGGTGAPAQGTAATRPAVNTGASVINIVVSSIAHDRIQARDGRTFAISDTTRIINNHDQRVKVVTAELFFQDGKLVSITIK